MIFALERPNDVDLALLVHVLGAMVLVGGLVTASAMTLIGWRDDSSELRRRATLTLLAVAFPAWIVMRVGAAWVYSKGYDQIPDDQEPAWIGLGFLTAELGGLLLIIALILGGIGMRKDRQGGGGTLLRISGAISIFLVLVYVVAIWAMGGKPD